MVQFAEWLKPTPAGLCCLPGGFTIDPIRPVERAVVTHGHGDHARPGSAHVLATPDTIEIMRARFGAEAGGRLQPLADGEWIELGGVRLRFAPAGHVLGSAQVVMEHEGQRAVVSGDYKRRPDPTAAPFELVPCDLFVTEATFGLPVFRHPPDRGEIGKLLDSLRLFPERTHLVGAYALGKAQRVLALLRQAGWERPIWLHGALFPLTDLYRRLGFDFGELRPATGAAKGELKGEIVLAPPGALREPWSRRMAEPVRAVASGWMGVRARARQAGAELPLVISDHADWDELTATIREVGAGEVWVTHGREEALVHYAQGIGIEASALSLVGYEDEEA
ncbi:MAG TPA: ligase-associated DNA damage response exonuclease [Dongiaceae bacterium]|jgi:putative mRNA 3-end processing factor|nr:ligase-associated DNA damage response exonuclease [Dongiaceae bacterium]